jgi:hypothetical protein
MVSSDYILSRCSGNNDLIDLGTRINGFVGKIEVEGHTGLCSFFNGGEGTAECGREAAKECSLQDFGDVQMPAQNMTSFRMGKYALLALLIL